MSQRKDTLTQLPGHTVLRPGIVHHDGTMTTSDDMAGREAICLVAANGLLYSLIVHEDGYAFMCVHHDTEYGFSDDTTIAEAVFRPTDNKIHVRRKRKPVLP